MTRPGARPLGAALGLIVDRAIGEPPGPHPLSLFGRGMGVVERRTYAPTRTAGAAYALTGATAGLASGIAVRSTAAATWLAVGAHSLHHTALDVADALARDDLDGARAILPSLVGRDPEALDQTEIARATIESVAENTIDAIVAPALWAAVGGAGGVLAHRAVDTLDSMVGYRNDRYEDFGWASARLDDLAAWVPARVGVALTLVVRPDRSRSILRAVRNDASTHPSPNAGLAEAAFAAALDLRLGGPTTYNGITEDRPPLGSGRNPQPSDIPGAVALSAEIGSALTAALAGYGLARLISTRRRRR